MILVGHVIKYPVHGGGMFYRPKPFEMPM